MFNKNEIKTLENKRMSELGCYYSHSTIKPLNQLSRVKNIFFPLPSLDWVVGLWLLISFVSFDIRFGWKFSQTKVKVKYSGLVITFRDVVVFVKKEWKQYLITSIIGSIVISLFF